MNPIRVLIVEDVEDDALLLVHALERELPVSWRRVQDREGMREALAENPWDLVVSDYGLPGFSAEAALELVRETGCDLPFLVVSGTVGEEAAIALLKAGAHDFVAKDRLARLVPAVRRELREAASRAERRRGEEELRRRSHDLAERVKEARCLYAVTRLMHATDAPIESLLAAAVRHVPDAMQWPEQARACIELDERFWCSHPDSCECPCATATLAAALPAESGAVGRLVVGYVGTLPVAGGPFLPEERELLAALAEIIGESLRRRRAEEEIRRREALFRTVIENGSDVVAILDATGGIRYESPAVERVLGYLPAERVGRNALELVHPDELEAVTARFAAGIHDPNASVRIRCRYRHADGHWVHLDAAARNLLDDPAVRGAVVISRDVTALVEAEERRRSLEQELRQAQKMEAVGRLAAGVAHDFNNLLTVISGHGELLAAAFPADDRHRRSAEAIVATSDRAAALTHQLLAFSRRQVLQPRVVDLGTVVGELEQLLHRLLGEDVELEIRPAPHLPPVLADPGQLGQVLLNLAVNARDAMPRGGRLTIETATVELAPEAAQAMSAERSGPWVALRVRDTGVGMTAEVREHVFEPFYTTKEGGTGLGLATVYGIVRQSGGQVRVESEPGRGTTMEVLLPPSPQPAEIEGPAQDEPATATSEREATVLLVEDEAPVRDLVREVLDACGYRVLEADRPESAVATAAAHRGPIDLLLTDVVMPGGNGRELAEALRTMRPEMRILFMTGYTDDAVLRHGLTAGRDELLKKPFTPTALARRVREALAVRAVA